MVFGLNLIQELVLSIVILIFVFGLYYSCHSRDKKISQNPIKLICSKCHTKNHLHHRFCEKCGNKLHETEKTHLGVKEIDPHKHMQKGKPYLILGSFILITLILFAPTKTLSYQIEVPYTDVERYTEKEPYQEQVAYEVQEPYEATETYTDMVPVPTDIPYQTTESYYETVQADNCNSNAGCSCIQWGGFFWSTCTKCSCLKQRSVTKYRSEIQQKEIQKERPVTKYRTITKYRLETKYRDVEKTREVLKTKMEDRYKEINWLFRFKVPWKLHLLR